MSSLRSRLVKRFIVGSMMRKSFDPFLSSIEDIRKKSDAMGKKIRLPKNAVVERIRIGEAAAEWLYVNNRKMNNKWVVLYFHSGGFCFGLGNNHRDFAIRLSEITGVKVLAVDYRLAPEFRYPSANEDCRSSYTWLLENGFSPENIIIGGDSAGAGLALMTLLSLRDAGTALPNASFFLSLMGGDFTDFDGESYESRKGSDPLNSKENVKRYCELYAGSSSIDAPVKQNLKGLPDMFLQVGSDEVLLSDSLLLAKRAEEAGVNVELEIWDGMWHVFQGFAMIVPEGKKAVVKLGYYINKKLYPTER